VRRAEIPPVSKTFRRTII